MPERIQHTFVQNCLVTELDARYWQTRYLEGNTPWDIGYAAPALVQYFQRIHDPTIRILIPGAGYGHEAAWLNDHGFANTWICDWAPKAIEAFINRHPDFPADRILCQDFFSLHLQVDLIIEQTFLSALPPSRRPDYARKCHQLLTPGGRFAGLLFSRTFEQEGPPFGGSRQEYLDLFIEHFSEVILEDCPDSIGPRMGSEVFIEARY